jgi:EAL domain-containing protein (putative c-di-GMP-specific phosphodiesterase class I)
VTSKITAAMQGDFTVAGVPLNVEVRMGYAVFPDHADSADTLWQHAGVAVRAAKGLHQSCLAYAPAIDDYDPKRLGMLSEIRRAIDANELVLHYQPKVDLRAGKATGMEALLRWNHPELGLLYPDVFLSLVEQTNLINPLTSWVLGNALRQAHMFDMTGDRLDLAVNLSARNLQNPNLVAEVLDMARSARVSTDRLTLEITETAIMVDPARGKSVLIALKSAGIRLSMDDFGVGHSSLTYLKDLPIDQIKIDKSFVMEIKDPRNRAIVRSAIEMGRNLELKVTAEGVEDAETADVLRELNCDIAQGYYFGKPMPAAEFSIWLRESPWGLSGHNDI